MNRRFIEKLSFFSCLAAILLMFAVAASAQEFRATITGTVTDPNGAIIPGATVIVKNVETNVATTVKTNDDGAYTIATLMPGRYNVTAAGTGFKTSSRENLEVRVDDRLTVDFKLDIGSEAEVTIVAGDEILERGTVSTGILISSRQVQELPLPEGAVFTLVTQSPGVNYTGNPQFTGPTANGNLAAFRTNGAGGNQINIDGSPNVGSNGAVAFTPPNDTVQEFKVQTNSFDAQNGFTAGSTVNVALKSGTNKLHGSVSYYNRDRSRTANNFFNNAQGRPRPERKYYRYNGTLNGPLYIPKIYDGRDKTFFLFGYEKQNDNVAEPTTFFVPTALQRVGNFSEILSTTPIYNALAPFTGGTCPAGNVCRPAFAGNIIPAGQINAIAQRYLALYPLPNLPVVNGVGRYATDMNLHRPYQSYLGRVEHNFNGSHKVFGKYYYSKSQEDRYNWFGQDNSPTKGYEYRINKGGNVDYTTMLSSSSILDIRASYNLFSLRRENANPISPSAIGFTGPALTAFGTATVMPRMDFVSFASSIISNAVGSNRSDYNEGRFFPFRLLSIQPTFTQIVGKHTFKFGYDFRKLLEELSTNGFNAGRFLFDGTYTTACATLPSPVTATCPTGGNNAGNRNVYGRDLAAFLLGIPTANANSLIDNPTVYDVKTNYQGFFVQDDWRVTTKLTLNLGLRYERDGGIIDSGNRLVSGFDTTSANPLQAAAQANFTALPPASVPTPFNVLGGLQFATDSNRGAQDADRNNLQPRIGVSYALNNRTVLRAGFGVFTAPFQVTTPIQSGFSNPTLFVPSTNNGLTFIADLNNPFPSGVAASPGASQGLGTSIGRDLTVLSHERKNAQYSRFVVGIQREMFWGLGLDIAYVNSRGRDLPVARQLNYIPASFLNAGSFGTPFNATVGAFLNLAVPNPFRTLVPSFATYNAATIARRNLLTPFPEFGNIAVTEYNGTSSYWSLQSQIIKRFTKGLSLNASYSFSSEKEKTQRLNPQDTFLTESLGANDRPHRFALSGIYELPIGRGRMIGKDWNSWADAFIGGWQFQANYEWQSGEPLFLGNVYFEGNPYNLVSRLGKKDAQGRRYGIDIPAFDIAGFFPGGVNNATTQAAIALGNINTIAGSNTLRYFPLTIGTMRNQRFLNFNAGMSKNFRIKEGMKLQFRIEAINVLNNPYFTALGLNPTAAGFGITSTQRQPPRDIQIGGRFTF
jgi:hypothetical protein